MTPVSSYLTISTLPQPNCFGGMFLLHFPYSYLRRTLSGILALWSPDFPHAYGTRPSDLDSVKSAASLLSFAPHRAPALTKRICLSSLPQRLDTHNQQCA